MKKFVKGLLATAAILAELATALHQDNNQAVAAVRTC